MTAGDLAVQIRMDSDIVLALQGMSPKGMSEIEETLAARKLIPVEEVPVVETAEVVVEPVVDATIPPTDELVTEVIPEAVKVETEPVLVPVVEEEVEDELPADLDKIFALRPEVFEVTTPSEEEEDFSDASKKAGGKKKKKKHTEVEYDPDRDVVLVHKKHKRGGDTWGDW